MQCRHSYQFSLSYSFGSNFLVLSFRLSLSLYRSSIVLTIINRCAMCFNNHSFSPFRRTTVFDWIVLNWFWLIPLFGITLSMKRIIWILTMGFLFYPFHSCLFSTSTQFVVNFTLSSKFRSYSTSMLVNLIWLLTSTADCTRIQRNCSSHRLIVIV